MAEREKKWAAFSTDPEWIAEARRDREERHAGDDVLQPVPQADELFVGEVICPTASRATIRLSAAPARSSACIVQSAAFARDADVMLDLIGVSEGWSCLDLGCGPGGITEPMSKRVGAERARDRARQGRAISRARAQRMRRRMSNSARATPMSPGCRATASTSCTCAFWRAPQAIRSGSIAARRSALCRSGGDRRAAGAGSRHAQLLSAASGLDEVEKRPRRGVQRRRRRCASGPAPLPAGASGGTGRRAVPAGPDRRSFDRSDGRLPARDG